MRLRLTGEHATDVADASGTLLFDVAARAGRRGPRRGSRSRASGFPPRSSRPHVSRRTPEGVLVAAGAGDQAAGALGVGVEGPGPLSVVLGTSGVVFAALPGLAADRTDAYTPSAAVPVDGTRWG